MILDSIHNRCQEGEIYFQVQLSPKHVPSALTVLLPIQQPNKTDDAKSVSERTEHFQISAGRAPSSREVRWSI